MSYIHVHVTVQVKPEHMVAFEAATRENARNSRKESGVIRFDLLRRREADNQYLLVEIYRDEAAVAAHKETTHYAAWRDAVADMMAAPRTSVKFLAVDPPDDEWS